MDRKGYERIGYWTYYATLNFDLTHDLDLGFSRSNFEKAVSQEWVDLLERNGCESISGQFIGYWTSHLELWPGPWHWHWICGTSSSNFNIAVFHMSLVQMIWNARDMNRQDDAYSLWLWPLTLHMILTLNFQGQILKLYEAMVGAPGFTLELDLFLPWHSGCF